MTCVVQILETVQKFQLTRSRGAWRVLRYKGNALDTISTHTLTWSVTKDLTETEEPPTISTHTLTWSVTKYQNRQNVAIKISTHTLTWSVTILNKLQKKNMEFQLTRSRGAWLGTYYTFSTNLAISTHTLTWSVTPESDLKMVLLSFQLTRSRGAWLEYSDSRGQTGNFNSHAHVERDKKLNTYYRLKGDFNSHAHVERDYHA